MVDANETYLRAKQKKRQMETKDPFLKSVSGVIMSHLPSELAKLPAKREKKKEKKQKKEEVKKEKERKDSGMIVEEEQHSP